MTEHILSTAFIHLVCVVSYKKGFSNFLLMYLVEMHFSVQKWTVVIESIHKHHM